MGYGDDIMATGLARGMAARGKLAAFGDGRNVIWGPWSKEIFRNNPNVAAPGSKGPHLEWIPHYKGRRLYNERGGKGWVWNYGFRPVPGEFFFDDFDQCTSSGYKVLLPANFVLIEPNVPSQKAVGPNKQWPHDRYQEVSDRLWRDGRHVIQLMHKGTTFKLKGAVPLWTDTFRQAAHILSKASLFIGPEGGMHHAAAAVGTPAVVLFGGFIPITVTGYVGHVNLGVDPKDACGSIQPCEHCRVAMEAISVDEVIVAAYAAKPAGEQRHAEQHADYQAASPVGPPTAGGDQHDAYHQAGGCHTVASGR